MLISGLTFLATIVAVIDVFFLHLTRFLSPATRCFMAADGKQGAIRAEVSENILERYGRCRFGTFCPRVGYWFVLDCNLLDAPYGMMGWVWSLGTNMMATELKGRDRWNWVFDTGWRGVCPRCHKGRMFSHWLKVAETCEECGLDYDFAAPDDGPAFFSLCFVAFPLLFLIVWFEVAINPPWWVHIFVSFPVMLVPCLLCLRPIKGWLVASQYINQAQEAGTGALWADLHARARGDDEETERKEPAEH